jgi:hypothetical protein
LIVIPISVIALHALSWSVNTSRTNVMCNLSGVNNLFLIKTNLKPNNSIIVLLLGLSSDLFGCFAFSGLALNSIFPFLL